MTNCWQFQIPILPSWVPFSDSLNNQTGGINRRRSVVTQIIPCSSVPLSTCQRPRDYRGLMTAALIRRISCGLDLIHVFSGARCPSDDPCRTSQCVYRERARNPASAIRARPPNLRNSLSEGFGPRISDRLPANRRVGGGQAGYRHNAPTTGKANCQSANQSEDERMQE